jgi:hypothetical protein
MGGEFKVPGFSLQRKMAHLSDDKTVAKMGHPSVVVRSDAGHPPENSTLQELRRNGNGSSSHHQPSGV